MSRAETTDTSANPDKAGSSLVISDFEGER